MAVVMMCTAAECQSQHVLSFHPNAGTFLPIALNILRHSFDVRQKPVLLIVKPAFEKLTLQTLAFFAAAFNTKSDRNFRITPPPPPEAIHPLFAPPALADLLSILMDRFYTLSFSQLKLWEQDRERHYQETLVDKEGIFQLPRELDVQQQKNGGWV